MRIIATIGPISSKHSILKALIENGADCIRLNFSHFNQDTFYRVVEDARKINKDIKIMADLCGRKIRISETIGDIYKVFPEENVYFCGEDVYKYLINKRDEKNKIIPLNISSEVLRNNVLDMISMKDGTMIFKVLEQDKGIIKAKCKSEGVIRGGKGCNIPCISISGVSLSEKDKENIKWAIDHKFNIISQSFAEESSDITSIKNYVEGTLHNKDKIIYYGKIESKRGVENLLDICDEVDGIIIARGDMVPECGIKKAVANQNTIINALTNNNYKKEIIIATHLLDNMIKNKKALYTEVEAIYNSLEKGVNGFLLAGETSIGKYPVESLNFLKEIIQYYDKK